jgi:hypothetical protein
MSDEKTKADEMKKAFQEMINFFERSNENLHRMELAVVLTPRAIRQEECDTESKYRIKFLVEDMKKAAESLVKNCQESLEKMNQMDKK